MSEIMSPKESDIRQILKEVIDPLERHQVHLHKDAEYAASACKLIILGATLDILTADGKRKKKEIFDTLASEARHNPNRDEMIIVIDFGLKLLGEEFRKALISKVDKLTI